MKRGVDGGGEGEKRKERRRNAESNDETDETRRDKPFRSKISFLFYFIFYTPIDHIISHPNKRFHWLLPHLRDVKQFRVASCAGPRKVLVWVARL
jgi:hypothetical protein